MASETDIVSAHRYGWPVELSDYRRAYMSWKKISNILQEIWKKAQKRQPLEKYRDFFKYVTKLTGKLIIKKQFAFVTASMKQLRIKINVMEEEEKEYREESNLKYKLNNLSKTHCIQFKGKWHVIYNGKNGVDFFYCQSRTASEKQKIPLFLAEEEICPKCFIFFKQEIEPKCKYFTMAPSKNIFS